MIFSFPGPVEPQLVVQALYDERVQRALDRALFDIRVRRDCRRLRREGMLVREAVEHLAEKHATSEETVRTVVYRKRRRQGRPRVPNHG